MKVFTVKGKSIQTYMALCRSDCPLNLITGRATLSSNNCNQVFAMTGSESFTALWRNVGPLIFAELL